jgi:hypothetical protein
MSINEILGTIHDGTVQVCATADADYDHASQRISVALEAFTRLASITGNGEHLPQPWLPPGERVAEHLPHSEADEFVKDVFHSWIKKLRAAVGKKVIVEQLETLAAPSITA